MSNTTTQITAKTDNPLKETEATLINVIPIIEAPISAGTAKKPRSYLVFILTVFIPSLWGLVYFGLLATDRFVSEAKMTVRTADGTASDLFGGFVKAVAGGSSNSEGYVVREYIKSKEIVTRLDQLADLRKLFYGSKIDYFSRLEDDATLEELHEYYLSRVSVEYDATSLVMTLTVEAFTAKAAQKIAQNIVNLSEQLVNKLSLRSRSDAVDFAKKEVTIAEKRLQTVRLELYKFRSDKRLIDPQSTAESFAAMISGLEIELVRYRTQLASVRTFLKEKNAKVLELKSKIDAIEKQILKEKSRLTNQNQPTALSNTLSEYEEIKIKEEFAKATYSVAIGALEAARAEAGRKQLYLISFVNPLVAEEATEPERTLLIFSTIILGFMAFGLLSLLLATIREHARA